MTIVSLNTRGLRNDGKRRKIWRYLKRQKSDICMVQETHATDEIENIWSTEWGNKCIFANGDSNARGVGLLFNKYFNKVIKVIKDEMGVLLL